MGLLSLCVWQWDKIMADRTVPTTDTFDQWRTTYNLTGTDVGDISQLNTIFTATPTDLVEAIIKSIYLKNNFFFNDNINNFFF